LRPAAGRKLSSAQVALCERYAAALIERNTTVNLTAITAIDDIAIGMPVELTWIDRDGVPFPAFRPASTTTVGGDS